MNNRLLSVDVFRGFTIALMIIVNSPGSWSNTFSPLLHADWNGITLTDFVYPFFIFIVGVSIVLSKKNKGTRQLDHKRLRRIEQGLHRADFIMKSSPSYG